MLTVPSTNRIYWPAHCAYTQEWSIDSINTLAYSSTLETFRCLYMSSLTGKHVAQFCEVIQLNVPIGAEFEQVDSIHSALLDLKILINSCADHSAARSKA
jgi:hypothetical protein